MRLAAFDDERFVFFATKLGRVKRTALADFDSPRSTLIAINLNEGDELMAAAVTTGDQHIVLVSREGYAIRFEESDARAMGRTAAGVRGMKLAPGDEVLGIGLAEPDGDEHLLVITERGYGKRTPLVRYPSQKRGGKGVITAKITEKNGPLVGALVVPYEAEILVISYNGTVIRMELADVAPKGRATQGVQVMRTGEGSSVVGVARVVGEEEDAAAG
jgi:DNA gyrase subunit A